VAPSPRYPRARMENNGQLRQLTESSVQENFPLEQDFCSNQLVSNVEPSVRARRGERIFASESRRRNCPDPPGSQEVRGSNPLTSTRRSQVRRWRAPRDRVPEFLSPRESGLTSCRTSPLLVARRDRTIPVGTFFLPSRASVRTASMAPAADRRSPG